MKRHILEFVDAKGERVIQVWLGKMRSRKATVNAKLDVRLHYLEVEVNPGRPKCAPLEGTNGLLEIRILAFNVQYRPIFFYGPLQSEVTLLADAIEKGGNLNPPDILDKADDRRSQAITERRRVCDYFS